MGDHLAITPREASQIDLTYVSTINFKHLWCDKEYRHLLAWSLFPQKIFYGNTKKTPVLTLRVPLQVPEGCPDAL